MKIFDTWHTFQIYSITQEGSPDRRTDKQTDRKTIIVFRSTDTYQTETERKTDTLTLTCKTLCGIAKKEADIFFL